MKCLLQIILLQQLNSHSAINIAKNNYFNELESKS